MASTALPLAFQTRAITNMPGIFIDGGTGVDTLPVVALLQRPEVSTVYLIVYNSAFSSGGADDLPFPVLRKPVTLYLHIHTHTHTHANARASAHRSTNSTFSS